MNSVRSVLQQGLRQLGLPCKEARLGQLLAYIKLIDKWNKAYNLTSVRNAEDMARLHILDSLTILPYLEDGNVIDIGTGAGLPGIPLAIFLPHVAFTLLDANAKKTRFVQQVVLELQLKNVAIQCARAERFQPCIRYANLVTRAFADIAAILKLTGHLLTENSVMLIMKGHDPVRELMQITEHYTVIPLTVPGMDARRCLVRIEREAEHD